MLQQLLLFLLGYAAFGDVLDRQQHHPAGDAFVADRESIELDRALAEIGEVLLELEALHRRLLGTTAASSWRRPGMSHCPPDSSNRERPWAFAGSSPKTS